MAVETPSEACTISGAEQLGSTSRNIRRSVLAFNLLGDGLRDALDPKLKR